MALNLAAVHDFTANHSFTATHASTATHTFAASHDFAAMHDLTAVHTFAAAPNSAAMHDYAAILNLAAAHRFDATHSLAAVLKSAASSESAAAAFRQAEGLPPLCELLRGGPQNPAAVNAAAALANVVANNGINQDAAADAGAVEAVVQLLAAGLAAPEHDRQANQDIHGCHGFIDVSMLCHTAAGGHGSSHDGLADAVAVATLLELQFAQPAALVLRYLSITGKQR